MFTVASASGNAFAYAWESLPAGGDGAAWARAVCPGLKLDGLFLLSRPLPGVPWAMEHWDADGACTFCSNGSRAALALPGAPGGAEVPAVSNGEAIVLRRDAEGVGILMPSGAGTGFKDVPADLRKLLGAEAAFGWIGNPQLVFLHTGVEGFDLAGKAPGLRHHPSLPGGTNVNVVEVLEPGTARIRSWERGVEGETLCCGTGCAVAGAWLTRRTGLPVWRFLPNGDPVTVTAALDGERWTELWLSGPARATGTVPADPSLLS